jgi:hypothetical protein
MALANWRTLIHEVSKMIPIVLLLRQIVIEASVRFVDVKSAFLREKSAEEELRRAEHARRSEATKWQNIADGVSIDRGDILLVEDAVERANSHALAAAELARAFAHQRRRTEDLRVSLAKTVELLREAERAVAEVVAETGERSDLPGTGTESSLRWIARATEFVEQTRLFIFETLSEGSPLKRGDPDPDRAGDPQSGES